MARTIDKVITAFLLLKTVLLASTSAIAHPKSGDDFINEMTNDCVPADAVCAAKHVIRAVEHFGSFNHHGSGHNVTTCPSSQGHDCLDVRGTSYYRFSEIRTCKNQCESIGKKLFEIQGKSVAVTADECRQMVRSILGELQNFKPRVRNDGWYYCSFKKSENTIYYGADTLKGVDLVTAEDPSFCPCQ